VVRFLGIFFCGASVSEAKVDKGCLSEFRYQLGPHLIDLLYWKPGEEHKQFNLYASVWSSSAVCESCAVLGVTLFTSISSSCGSKFQHYDGTHNGEAVLAVPAAV
jgi:hypothetical protein